MILAEVSINPEIIFVLLALIASGVKTYFDRKKAASSDLEEDDDVYDEYREEIAQQQRTHPQAEIWPKPEPKRGGQQGSQKPPPLNRQSAPPSVPVPDSIGDLAQNLGVNLQPGLKKVVPPKLSASEQKALANFQKNSAIKNSAIIGAKVTRRRPSALRKVLSDPHAIKQAIVLNEILGKPKGQ